MNKLIEKARYTNIVVVVKLNKPLDLKKFMLFFGGEKKRNFVVTDIKTLFGNLSVTAFSTGLLIVRNIKSPMLIEESIASLLFQLRILDDYEIVKYEVVNVIIDVKLDTKINMFHILDRCKDYLLPWFEPESCPFGIHLKGKYATYLVSPNGNVKILNPQRSKLKEVFKELEEILKKAGIDVN